MRTVFAAVMLCAACAAAVPAAAASGVRERDLSYDGGAYGPVTATVVAPATPGAASPGILWVHWLGTPATTNRTEFLADARALAARGATSVLVDAMWSRADWFTKGRKPATDERDLLAQVAALRRGLDLLGAQPGVDPAALTLVGHDYGAMYGAIAASQDARVTRLVLLAPSLAMWDWFLFGEPPADVPAYVARLSAYDLPRVLPGAHASAVLGQFAENDLYVPVSNAWTFRSLFGGRDVTTKRYKTDHALATEDVRADRDAWLIQHLGLRS